MPQEDERKTRQEAPIESKSISRREFLKDAGLVVGGAAVGSAALLSACGKTATVTSEVTTTLPRTVTTTATAPGGTATLTTTITSPPITKVVEVAAAPARVTLSVNGRKSALEVEPHWTLQYVLREKLGLLSPKDMCFGNGACGSCSVIVDGRAVLSCMALASELEGAVIETAEGIADKQHPLVEAYITSHCMQCGYCTPGFLVTAKALLDSNKKPTEAEIKDALSGNLCRCGTYPAHWEAVRAVAQKAS